jgi:ATP-dependent protease HslVU (ClpYQ) peptidase subunit
LTLKSTWKNSIKKLRNVEIMTTLIITEKGFYSDSQVTAGDTVLSSDYDKIFMYKGRIIAVTGNPCELTHYIKKYIDGESFENKSQKGCCMIRFDGETRMISFYDNRVEDTIEIFTRCLGSGGDWAQAALDFGKTPKEAIRYAMTKDPYTGGKVKKIIFSKIKGL